MEEYQKRVISEADGLSTKLYNLERFMKKDEFSPGSNAEHAILVEQHKAMEKYLEILRKRIKLWEK